MGFIYQKAYLTIAAISSPNSSGGCFLKDKWPDECIKLSDSSIQEYTIGARILDRKGPPVTDDDIEDHYPILKRGWVFQERLMSTRLVMCNYGEFTFECLRSTRCECKSALAPHLGRNSRWATNLNFTQQRRFLLQEAQGALSQGERDAWKDNALKYWKTIVKTYMQLELGHPSSVLPAIAGCAQTFAPSLKLTYIAGMWKETLATDLLWYVLPIKAKSGPKSRPKGTTAPSWS